MKTGREVLKGIEKEMVDKTKITNSEAEKNKLFNGNETLETTTKTPDYKYVANDYLFIKDKHARETLLNMTQEERNEKKVAQIKEKMKDDIRKYSAEEIEQHCVINKDAKMPYKEPEEIAEEVLTNFYILIRAVEKAGLATKYNDIKDDVVHNVLSLFTGRFKKELKEGTLTTERKRQMLLESVDKRIFDVCKWNREHNNKGYLDMEDCLVVAKEIDVEKELNKKSGYKNEEEMVSPVENEEVRCSPFGNDVKMVPVENEKEHIVVDEHFKTRMEPKTPNKSFEYKGKRYCEIKFAETKVGNQPITDLFSAPRCFELSRNNGKVQWIFSDYHNLSLEEVEALKPYFKKANRIYKLDRKILQNIMNYSTTTESPLK